MRLFKVTMASEVFAKEFVHKDAGLWEAVHAAANFHVGISI